MITQTTAATDSKPAETSAAVVASPPRLPNSFPSAPPAAATPNLRPGVAGGAASCWDYVQRSGLLDRCHPDNRNLIKAAYEDCYQTTGDATLDDRPMTVDLISICKLSAARTIAEASGYLSGRAA